MIPVTRVLHRRGFVRLWSAQIVSGVGDWEFALAVSTALATRLEAGSREGHRPARRRRSDPAVFGLLFAGPIVDRFPRGPLMVAADLVRMVATASLLLAPHPSMLHLWCVAACLGVFGALFQPSLLASVPNVVDEEEITAANAIMTGTFHTAIMVGLALGAALVAFLGPALAYALNAASFGVSAVLVATARIPRQAGEEGSWAPVADQNAGAPGTAGNPLARGIVIAMFLLLFFTAMKRPAETVPCAMS
jgi:MFS family permease